MEWRVIKPDVFAAIMDFFTSGLPVVNEDSTPSADTGKGFNQLCVEYNEIDRTKNGKTVSECQYISTCRFSTIRWWRWSSCHDQRTAGYSNKVQRCILILYQHLFHVTAAFCLFVHTNQWSFSQANSAGRWRWHCVSGVRGRCCKTEAAGLLHQLSQFHGYLEEWNPEHVTVLRPRSWISGAGLFSQNVCV